MNATHDVSPGSESAVARDYLARLDRALGPLPHAVATELRAGIAEELRGLDDSTVTAKLAELGDPELIVAAARETASPAPGLDPLPAAAAPAAPAASPAPPAPVPLTESRGYAIAAAIILGVGFFALPVVGWIIGAVLVCTSRMWTRGEKLWAVLFVPLTPALISIVYSLANGFSNNETDVHSPLVPTLYDTVWSSWILLGLIVAPLTGLWLILRLRGRRFPVKKD